VADSHLFDNTGNGVLVAPPAGGNATATLRENLIVGNGCGIAATNHLPDPAFNFAVNCGTQVAGVGGPAKINAFSNVINENDLSSSGGPPPTNGSAGVFTNGQTSVARISDNVINANTFGLRAIDVGGTGTGVVSYSDNFISGNVFNGVANSFVATG
jgi:hypothetical protein